MSKGCPNTIPQAADGVCSVNGYATKRRSRAKFARLLIHLMCVLWMSKSSSNNLLLFSSPAYLEGKLLGIMFLSCLKDVSMILTIVVGSEVNSFIEWRFCAFKLNFFESFSLKGNRIFHSKLDLQIEISN